MLRIHIASPLIRLFMLKMVFLVATQSNAQFSTVHNLPPDPDFGANFTIYSDTQLNLSTGGVVGEHFHSGDFNGTSTNIEINMTGGEIQDFFEAFHGTTAHISGGLVGQELLAYDGSTINISGGSIGQEMQALDGSIINISGGTVGKELQAHDGGEINISGGSVSFFFRVFGGGVANISAGEIGNLLRSYENSIVNISGGSIGTNFETSGLVNISGGNIANRFETYSGSVVNISGGTIGDDFDVFASSEVNFFGRQFVLDGNDITGTLTTNTPFTITDRNVTLSGILADGTAFSYDLNSTNSSEQDYFDNLATLTTTLIQPGDFDDSLDVNGIDFLRWQRGLANPYDTTDYANWQASFGTAAPAVAAAIPEPSTTALLLFSTITLTALRRKRY